MRGESHLTYEILDDNIDITQVAESIIEMRKKEEYLKNHSYWYDKNKQTWITFIPDETRPTKRRQVKRKNKKELEDIIYSYYKDLETSVTVMQVFEMWLDRRSRLNQISPSTRDRYLADAKRYFSDIANKDVKQLTPVQLSKHLEETVGKYCLTMKSYCGLKTILRGAFKYAFREGYIHYRIDDVIADTELSPSSFRKTFKEDDEEVFDEFETEKLLKYLISNLDNPKHIVILLSLLTGMRVGEATTIKHSDIFENTIKVRRTHTRYKENGKYIYAVKDYAKTEAGMRTVIVPTSYAWIIDFMENLNPNSEYIFQDRNGKPYSDHAINNRLTQICQKLNLVRKSSHKLRKTWFSIVLDNHVDNNMITKIGGHTNIMTSERNYHRNRKTLKRMSDVVSDIDEFKMTDELNSLLAESTQKIRQQKHSNVNE